MKRTEITVTSKGHCNLSGVRTQDHSFYLATEDADGVITLVPASLVPARLASVMRGSGLMEKAEPLPWKEEN
jgi:hypothetical protein